MTTDPKHISMATDLLFQSIMAALLDRETAVRALVPDTDDRNAVLMTAVSLAIGTMLIGVTKDAADYQSGVETLTKVLSLGYDKYRAVHADAHRRREARHGDPKARPT